MKRCVICWVVAVWLLGACAPGPASNSQSPKPATAIPARLSGPVAIEYWYAYGSTVGQAIEAAVARFNQKYAGQIVVKPVFQGTFDQELAKVRAAAAGGGLPQVVTARDSDVGQYDQATLLVDLDPYLENSVHGVKDSALGDLYPGVIGRTKLAVWGNRTMSWPFGNTAAAWYYNQDVMRQAHIDNPPLTWDDVLTDARAIKASTGQPLWAFRQDQAGPIFIDTLWTFGIPWLSAQGRATNFDDPAATEVLTMFRQLVDDGSMLVSGTAEDDFPSGRAAMLWASSGNIVKYSHNITAFQWGVTLPPRKSDVQPITEMFGSVNAVFKSNPDQQLASWIFITEMASAETQSQFAADAGYFPSTRSSASSEALQTSFSRVPQFKVAVDQIAPYMQLLPQSAALDQVRNRLATDVVTQVLLKKISPPDGARQLKTQADLALKQAGS